MDSDSNDRDDLSNYEQKDRQVACHMKNIEDLQKANQLLKSPSSDFVADALSSLARHRNQPQLISGLLTPATDVNSVDINKRTPLHIAMEKGNDALIRALLDHGVETNLKDDTGKAPLHCAVRKDNKSIVLSLLKQGAHINLQDSTGQTPLHVAVSFASQKDGCFSVLLEKGAETNVKDNLGKTPLHRAFDGGPYKFVVRLTAVKELLHHGAEVNIKDDSGKSPLHHAVKNWFSEDSVSDLLEHGAHVNATDFELKTPLHIACEHCSSTNIAALLRHGADTDLQDFAGRTPLHIVIETCAEFISLHVLSHVVMCDLKDKSGKTPLHCAAKRDIDVQVLSALLHRGADIDSKDGQGKTPLHWAIEHGSERNVLALIKHGADINLKDYTDRTSLHYAAKRGFPQAVSTLLECGANANSKDVEGKTPLYVYAETDGSVSKRQLLSCAGHSVIAELLLESGADVDCKDKSGKTALYVAAKRGYVRLIYSLLKYGADVNVRAGVFHTPLTCAKEQSMKNTYGREIVVDILENHIVKLNTLNFRIDRVNLDSIDFSCPRVQQFVTKCEIELTRSETVKLVNGHKIISFHDILTKNNRYLSRFLKNGISSDVSEVLRSELRGFPIFRDMIAFQFRLAVEREPLFQQTTLFVDDLFPILPAICVDVIIDYLNNRDLNTLITACRSTDE